MEGSVHSLNYELPQELHFDKYAQHILENSRTPNLADTATIALDSSPSLTSLELPQQTNHLTTTSEFLKKLGATFIHSIQLQSLPRASTLDSSYYPGGTVHKISSASSSSPLLPDNDMDMEFGPHHLLMDSDNYNSAMDDIQKQLDYDKFMNEVWIGVVLTLILISMIFCFCSCFLYHQFRMWKRNYRTTVIPPSTDCEAVKLNIDLDDPVPEYALVSGLPSYEAALELLHKNPQSCLIVPPSVFEVFNRNEKSHNENSANTEDCAMAEVSAPLLSNCHNETKCIMLPPTNNEITSDNVTTTTANSATAPALTYNHSLVSLLSLVATPKSSQCKTKSHNASSATISEADKQFKA